MVCSLKDAKNYFEDSVPCYWDMESLLKMKDKLKNSIYKHRGAMCGSKETFLQKMPIHRAIENFFTLQILQLVGIV
jgi:hypothetical protein